MSKSRPTAADTIICTVTPATGDSKLRETPKVAAVEEFRKAIAEAEKPQIPTKKPYVRNHHIAH